MRVRSLLMGAALALAAGQGAASADGERFSASRIVYQEKSLYRNILVAEGDGYRCMKWVFVKVGWSGGQSSPASIMRMSVEMSAP